MTLPDRTLDAIRLQRDGTVTSPLYRSLLAITVDDAERGGITAEVLAQTDPAVEPVADALALRFLGGVHRVVLDGRAPSLARYYPSAGGHHDPEAPVDALAAAFLATVADHRAELVDALGHGVQTNEVGRCAALLLGFLTVARTATPRLRVLEVGASAGLNLRWDRFRYEGGAGGSAWGDLASPLRFTDVYAEPLPMLDAEAEVVERRGCDRSPIDATTAEGRSLLRSFVWPDQPERFAMLDAALDVAASTPATVDQADAAEWVEAQLAARPLDDGVSTVLYHSIVWQYLPRATKDRVRDALAGAGQRATTRAPVAWLRMEPGEDPARAAEVRLQVWPGGQDHVVARTGYHGRPVRARVR